jgi:hypothetical protein
LKKSWAVWSGLREWLEILPDAELDSELSCQMASIIERTKLPYLSG